VTESDDATLAYLKYLYITILIAVWNFDGSNNSLPVRR